MPFPEGLEWNQAGVEPTQAKKDEGWLPEEKPPAEYFNWFFNRMSQAVNHLDEGNKALFRQPNTAYSIGDVCYSATTANYKRFECTIGGISGAMEPAWPGVGQTIVDGAVTWKVRNIVRTDPTDQLSAPVPVAKGGTGAADAGNARANLGAMAAPVGGSGSGVPGEVRVTLFGSGVQPVAPTGGTWFWSVQLVFGSSALTVVNDQTYYGAGIAAGGANIAAPATGYVRAFLLWRIA